MLESALRIGDKICSTIIVDPTRHQDSMPSLTGFLKVGTRNTGCSGGVCVVDDDIVCAMQVM